MKRCDTRQAGKRGWLDAVAFDTDFVWREFDKAPWLAARRAEQRSRLAAERSAALAGKLKKDP